MQPRPPPKETSIDRKVNTSHKIFDMDFRPLIPPLTPRDRIEDRREERESRRSFLKHHYHSPWRFWALVLDYLTWVKVEESKKHLEHQAQLLKALVLIPKFCNGLIGVSLTDSITAPATT